MQESEARRRFAAARVARLATVRTDGRPHLVPIMFATDGNLIYSIVDAKPKQSMELVRLTNIRREPRVSLLVDAYDEVWERLWWVRVDGQASVVASGHEHAAAIRLLQGKYPQYRESAGSFGAAIVTRVDRWSSWAFRP
ncbi:MAG: TIGR03668 family PPOX class F420-dependent oxidoreductase [Candidatus Limnocylindria bacterium]